ncbi:MAG: pantetheine-phosphate adenylyltransferase [Fidelibacterota bacterium]
MRTAVYPGTFDPITYGHLDIIIRALSLFDKLIVTIAENSTKKPLFDLEERIKLIEEATQDLQNIEVDHTSGLIVDYAQKREAVALVRGLRFVSDFEFEFQMAWMNRHLDDNITTIFLMPHRRYAHLNSTVIREVVKLGGNIDVFVPPGVSRELKRKFDLNG